MPKFDSYRNVALFACAAWGVFNYFCNTKIAKYECLGVELSQSVCNDHTLLSSAVVVTSAAAFYSVAAVKDFIHLNVNLADKASEVIGLKAFAEITGIKALGYNAIRLADKATEITGLKTIGKMALQRSGLFGTNNDAHIMTTPALRRPSETVGDSSASHHRKSPSPGV